MPVRKNKTANREEKRSKENFGFNLRLFFSNILISVPRKGWKHFNSLNFNSLLFPHYRLLVTSCDETSFILYCKMDKVIDVLVGGNTKQIREEVVRPSCEQKICIKFRCKNMRL